MISSHKLLHLSRPCFWGVDIGGANIKLCGPSGHTISHAFPFWTHSHRLSETLLRLIADVSKEDSGNKWDSSSVLAITMTAELADCFRTRREGVAAILDQLNTLIPPARSPIYSVDGSWLTAQEARTRPWSVAASNWHALTNWCLNCEALDPNHLSAIMDIGSTTVDIIPVKDGQICTRATTDRQRLQLGQLVYTGMERTPIHAIVRSLTVEGLRTPIMAEKFATIHDAYLVLCEVHEESDNCDTADGRPRTREAALGRLARMVGEDAETLSEGSIVRLAREICRVQVKQIERALERNLPDAGSSSAQHGFSDRRVLVSGHGKPMVNRLRSLQRLKPIHFVYLEDILGKSAARCAPALAVAQLCAQFCDWYRTIDCQ